MAFVSLNNIYAVVYVISFDTVENLDFLALLFCLGGGVHGVRKRLHHPVVGYCDCLMPPFGGAQNQRLGIADGIHCGHFGMRMQLNPLGFCGILFYIGGDSRY